MGQHGGGLKEMDQHGGGIKKIGQHSGGLKLMGQHGGEFKEMALHGGGVKEMGQHARGGLKETYFFLSLYFEKNYNFRINFCFFPLFLMEAWAIHGQYFCRIMLQILK